MFRAGFIALLFSFISTHIYAQPAEVDVKIVIAVDASGSVDAREFRLQIEGISRAIRHPDVQFAARSGPVGQVLAAVLIWSDASHSKHSTKWHLLNSAQSFEAFASEIDKFKTVSAVGGGGTNIGDALVYAISMIEQNQVKSGRDVVDVSGDGPETKPWAGAAIALEDARKLARRRGITVNGLAIETDVDGLHLWYRQNLIVGANSFVEIAADFDDFKQAIVRKLLRELSGGMFSELKPLTLAQNQ